MPLIVHSSSTCDVCLNSYVFDDGRANEAPHAIPCGHIFCKECLDTIIATRNNPFLMSAPGSGVCPLCRKPFRTADYIKKLHLDPPPAEPESPRQSEDQVFIQRLISLNWHSTDTVTDPETRDSLTEEIEAYLTDKPDEECAELRAAISAFKEHRKNVGRRRHAERKLKEYELRAVKAESGSNMLQSQLEDLASELEAVRIQLQAAEENAAANAAAAANAPSKKSRKGKEKELHNPLPLPPIDVTSDRYTDFARRAIDDIPITQTELNTPMPYPPPLPDHLAQYGSKSTTTTLFPHSEMERVRFLEPGPSSSKNDIIPGASADSSVTVKKERKHKKRHRSHDNDMIQSTGEIYPGGYIEAPFPIMEEDTPRAPPRQLDAPSTSQPPPPSSAPRERTTVHRDNYRPPSSQGSFASWGQNNRNSTSTFGSGINALRSSFSAAPIDEEELEVPVGDTRAFLPPNPNPHQPAPSQQAPPPISASHQAPPSSSTSRRQRRRTLPADEHDNLEIPVGDPRAFLPINPPSIYAPSSSRTFMPAAMIHPPATSPPITTMQQASDHRHRPHMESRHTLAGPSFVPPVPLPVLPPPQPQHIPSSDAPRRRHGQHRSESVVPGQSYSQSQIQAPFQRPATSQLYAQPTVYNNNAHALGAQTHHGHAGQQSQNALGLDLSRHAATPNPHIIAPTPQSATSRSFLRTLSGGG